MNGSDYRVSAWPRIRNLVELAMLQQRPCTSHGHVEIDVTLALDRIRALKGDPRTSVSLNTYMLYALSRIAARHEVLRTYRFGRKRVVFEHADVMQPMLKRLPGGQKVPVFYIVRAADAKSLCEINREFKDAVARSDLADDPAVRLRRSLVRLPAWIQRGLYRYLFSHPERMNRYFGNMGVTTMRQEHFGIPLVGHPPNVYSAQFLLGNVSEKFLPDARKQPVLRSVMQIGAGFDHLVMDGMHITALSRDLAAFVARGDGLDEAFVQESRQEAARAAA